MRDTMPGVSVESKPLGSFMRAYSSGRLRAAASCFTSAAPG